MDEKNDFRNEELLRLYTEEGKSINEIIETLDISYDTALRLLKKEGVYKTPAKKKQENQKNEIRNMLLDGDDAHSVAFETKTPVPIVKKILTEEILSGKKFEYAGKVFDSYQEMEAFRKKVGEDILRLSKAGLSNNEIAQQLGVSLKTVGRFLK